MTKKIIGIAGSLRQGSYNAALLRAAAELAPASVTIEIASIRGIALYDGDVEAQGIPEVVAQLKDRIATADALLLVTPEYNNSIPGVFKNAIDWLSRPPADIPRVFAGRKVAVMGASPGRFGTLLSQTAWMAVIRTLGMQPWYGASLYLSAANTVFDSLGKLTDAATKERLIQFLSKFAEFVAH